MLFCVQCKEITGLRKKLESLESALGSPSDTAAGLARRLIKESPAPSTFFTTPKLSHPTSETREIDLDTSTDLFATPKPRSPPKKRPRNEQPQRTSDVRVPSAVGKTSSSLAVGSKLVGKPAVKNVLASRQPAGKPGAGVSASSRNINGLPSASNVGGMLGKKIPFGVSVNFPQSSSIFREGYNGFGGHEKLVVPPARTQQYHVVKKLLIGGPKKQFFGPLKTAPAPPLPSLSDSD